MLLSNNLISATQSRGVDLWTFELLSLIFMQIRSELAFFVTPPLIFIFIGSKNSQCATQVYFEEALRSSFLPFSPEKYSLPISNLGFLCLLKFFVFEGVLPLPSVKINFFTEKYSLLIFNSMFLIIPKITTSTKNLTKEGYHKNVSKNNQKVTTSPPYSLWFLYFVYYSFITRFLPIFLF